MNVKEIILDLIERDGINAELKAALREYLEDDGYEGLAGDNCGCELNDLMACGGDGLDCEPGYKVPCTEECEYHDQGCEWHITTVKPESEATDG
ncbi:MAG TPA: hypothetical protein VMV77_19710 [Bacteroidales bacterium]|nr:hypothetical protein [Bacteroidales bacterium]